VQEQTSVKITATACKNFRDPIENHESDYEWFENRPIAPPRSLSSFRLGEYAGCDLPFIWSKVLLIKVSRGVSLSFPRSDDNN
jgi:hypothetical protein